jgi:hypothetical protein
VLLGIGKVLILNGKRFLHFLCAVQKNPYGSSTLGTVPILIHKVVHRKCAKLFAMEKLCGKTRPAENYNAMSASIRSKMAEYGGNFCLRAILLKFYAPKKYPCKSSALHVPMRVVHKVIPKKCVELYR